MPNWQFALLALDMSRRRIRLRGRAAFGRLIIPSGLEQDTAGLWTKRSSERFFACRARTRLAGRVTAAGDVLCVEEGNARFSCRSQGPARIPRRIYPSGFSDAAEYKALFVKGANELYAVEQQRGPTNTDFGVRALGMYFRISCLMGRDPRDVKLVAFDPAFPYAGYNWEVFLSTFR